MNLLTLLVLLTGNADIGYIGDITGEDHGCRDLAMGFEVPAEFFCLT